MSIGVFKEMMDVYIWHKFCGLLSSTSAINAAQLRTASINQHSAKLIHLRPPEAARLCFATTC